MEMTIRCVYCTAIKDSLVREIAEVQEISAQLAQAAGFDAVLVSYGAADSLQYAKGLRFEDMRWFGFL